MSLDYNLTEVKDCDEVAFVIADTDDQIGRFKAGDKILRHEVRELIFATMAVDMGSITEKNVDEFFFRVSLWRRWHGLEPVKYELVKSLIGMRTNVLTVARGPWLTRMADGWYKSMVYDLRREEKNKLLKLEEALTS